ncbi:MAG: YihA family ribosome biogenesis GTP-binding protein [Clostridia bacterium]|nr:YihA family ribosome biogenesis GTP-binding protein [Clostridia bacterium]MBQ7769679.1 YihA family ribosome biogenesis GTP-binding protein [Clostridia bacterium]MBQ8875917.1 YihA family ribosome biogenesis GTP-binding protein [Clostridia bacterium]
MYETKKKYEEKQPPLVIKNATFITSAAKKEQFITPDKPMIAVCGKSNVGKSSFINMLANRKKLAKTSSEPGRTRLVNYFDFGEFILADLPGYGFARVSKGEKEKWAKTLDDFFKDKAKISHVFMLVDSRHDPTADDVQMIEYLHYHTLPFTVTLTKSDKLSRMKLNEHIRAIAADLYLAPANLIATSSETGYGKIEVLTKIKSVIDLANQPLPIDDAEETNTDEE